MTSHATSQSNAADDHNAVSNRAPHRAELAASVAESSSFVIRCDDRQDVLDSSRLHASLIGHLTLRPPRAGDEPHLVRHANNRNVWINCSNRFPHPYTGA